MFAAVLVVFVRRVRFFQNHGFKFKNGFSFLVSSMPGFGSPWNLLAGKWDCYIGSQNLFSRAQFRDSSVGAREFPADFIDFRILRRKIA